jgi:hypothetical protein
MKTIIINGYKYKGSDVYGELHGEEITVDELYQTYENRMDANINDLEDEDVEAFVDFVNLQFNI